MQSLQTYSQHAGSLSLSSLAMDMFYPAQTIRPAPVVFNIHGGGGFFGNRQLKGWDARLRDELNSRGFVVGSTDYRLAPLYSGEDQTEDANHSMSRAEWLRSLVAQKNSVRLQNVLYRTIT